MYNITLNTEGNKLTFNGYQIILSQNYWRNVERVHLSRLSDKMFHFLGESCVYLLAFKNIAFLWYQPIPVSKKVVNLMETGFRRKQSFIFLIVPN